MEGWLKDGKFEIKLIDGRIQRQIRTKTSGIDQNVLR